jgi:Protein of unknown function (DUF3147)
VGSIGVLALRALAGGALVAAFSVIGQIVSPKSFSGLFSASPSVAVAGLTITVVAESPAAARQASIGMVTGSAALTVCCVLAAVAIPRIGSFWGSLAAWLGWTVAGLGLYWAVFIGAR